MSGARDHFTGAFSGFAGSDMAMLRATVGPLAPVLQLTAAIYKSQKDFKDTETKKLPELTEEARRQSIIMAVQTHQAQLAQELAIAHRIALSDEVEIEEFYDVSGKGGAGLQADGTGVNLGATGEGRKVTKRIIKFRGWGPGVDGAIEPVSAQEPPADPGSPPL